jgi:hypothetical protein
MPPPPPHQHTLAVALQGIYQATYLGAGVGLGALVGGLLMEVAGGQALFAATSLLVLAGWAGTAGVEAWIAARARSGGGGRHAKGWKPKLS